MSARKAFDADLARYDKALREADAIVTDADGFAWVDESKIPSALASAYRRLLAFGYANGLMPERAS